LSKGLYKRVLWTIGEAISFLPFLEREKDLAKKRVTPKAIGTPKKSFLIGINFLIQVSISVLLSL
jgi:hypothetical protein